jgi:hypothetical protein
MSAKRKNYKNHKYAHLLLVYPTHSKGAGKGVYWMAKCDCGQLKELRGSDVVSGRIKTCGECEYHQKLLQDAGEQGGKVRGWTKSIRVQHTRYIRSAVKRGIEWRLSPEEFLQLIKKNCTYCNASPRIYNSKPNFGRGKTVKTLMNGIDRKDSSLGYISGNVVPCCSVCNKMKMSMAESDFRIQILKIAKCYLEKAGYESDISDGDEK